MNRTRVLIVALVGLCLLNACGGGASSGSGVSSSGGGAGVNPVPSVSSLSPASTTAGAAAFELTVNGDERAGHTATLLLDGRVLLTGGWKLDANFSTVNATAELFDAATGACTATGRMAASRTGHSATLLANTSAEIYR